MKNALILSALLTLGPVCFAQQTEKYPLGNYEELTDTKPHDGAEVWNKMTTPTCLSWGTTDIRYKKLNVPDIKKTTRWKGKAWKGERINAQAVLWTKEALDDGHRQRTEKRLGHHPGFCHHDELRTLCHDRRAEQGPQRWLRTSRKQGRMGFVCRSRCLGYCKNTGYQSLYDTTDLAERMGSVRCPRREI